MVEAKCLLILLSCFAIMISSVCAFHPVAVSQSAPNQQNAEVRPPDVSSLSEEKHDISFYLTDGGSQEHPLNDPRQNDVENEAYDVENEKRGYNKNYLRFGRNYDAEKRGVDRNFLRFGRNDSPLMSALYSPSDLTEEEKKSTRNFLRFGRGPERNFLRFGRKGPLELGLDMQSENPEEMVKRGDDRNFLRFGKASDRNFLRFGRSTKMQMKQLCKDCEQDTQLQSATSLEKPSDIPETTTKRTRSKRSLSAYYDDVLFMDPMTPLPWTNEYNNYNPSTNTQEKRGHSRNFLRYGRDPLDLHFLRFGKRGSDEAMADQHEDDADHMARYVRGRSSKNFIRFG